MPDDESNPLDDAVSPADTEPELRSTLSGREDTDDDYYVSDLETHLDAHDYSKDQLKVFRDIEQEREDPRSTALDAIESAFDDATSGPNEPGDAESRAEAERQAAADRAEQVAADEDADVTVESDVSADTDADADADADDADRAALVDADADPDMGAAGDTAGVEAAPDDAAGTESGLTPAEATGHGGSAADAEPAVDESASDAEDDGDSDFRAELGTPVADDGVLRINHGGGATAAGTEGVYLPSPYGSDAPEQLQIVLPKAMGFAGEFFEAGEYKVAYAEPNEGALPGMRVKRALESPNGIARLSVDDPLHPEHEESGSSPDDHLVG